MSFHHSPSIVKDGLVLCLDAKDLKSYSGSGTTWVDRSGNGNNGTLVNGVSAIGGSMVFDGVNDYVSVNNIGTLLNAIGLGDFCLSFWFNFTKSSRGDLFCWKTTDSTDDIGIILDNILNTIQVFFKINGSGGYTALSVPYQKNTPQQFILQRESGILKGILNASLISSTSNTLDLNLHNETQVRLGSNIGILYMQGSIYNTLIYNRALSPAEILQNYNATKSRFNLL
jgi:hypothetical protein